MREKYLEEVSKRSEGEYNFIGRRGQARMVRISQLASETSISSLIEA